MSILRSAARILVATAIPIATIVSVAALILRQPTLTGADRLTTHADPDVLRRDVVALTSMGRCADDPESLDRAAAYIARRFEESGAGVTEQVYVARRPVYRNVIARFDGVGAPIIVGAHYDSVRAHNISM